MNPGRTARVTLLVVLGAPVVLLVVAPGAALLVFAGVLLAVALRGAGGVLARPLGLPVWAGVAAAALGGMGLLGLAGWFAAPALVEQADELLRRLPTALASLRDRLDDTPLERLILEEIGLDAVMARLGPHAAGVATTAVSTTAGGLTNALYLLFLGVFLAASPKPYLAGLRALLAPPLRPVAEGVTRDLASALRAWAGAQLVAMAVVGALTYAGLTLLELPLAGVLALLAALLGFIPVLGPILAGVPAVLLALVDGWSMALWTTGLYVAVRVIEGDVVTPLMQGRALAMPPGVLLVVQVVMLSLFGLLGAALAAPLAAVLLVLARRLYVEGFVERSSMPAEPAEVSGGRRRGAAVSGRAFPEPGPPHR